VATEEELHAEEAEMEVEKAQETKPWENEQCLENSTNAQSTAEVLLDWS
jgi:hypothetical protein